METQEFQLSPSERVILTAKASGADRRGIAPDWVALQSLKQFGLIDEIAQGHKVTAAGRRVLASGRGA
jgi:ribosomal protein S19E (S16A)